MDSKGCPTAADIPDKQILEAVRQFSAGVADMPEKALAHLYPVKVIRAKMAKLERREMLEYGVTLRTAWLTEKGREALT